MANKKRTTVLCITILLFVSMIAVVGIMCSYLLTYTPERPNGPSDTVVHYDENNNPVVMVPQENENFNFLVLGRDRIANLTDVIMLINYNVTDGSIAITQFPRDTYVSYGVATSKINATYPTFYNQAVGNGSKQPELDALRRFADVLEEALCTKISYCAIMNLNGFVNIVDAIGGVEVDVPGRMYYNDPEQGLYINLQPGLQTLDGAHAEQFVRFRDGLVTADSGRQDLQKIFMSAFIKEVQTSVNVGNITTIAETVLDNLYTDVTVSDIVYFGKNLLNVDLSNIKMINIPSTWTGSHMVISKSKLLEIVNEYYNLYDKPISESIFDKNKAFWCEDNTYYQDLYNSDLSEYENDEHNADDILDGAIDIPFKY